MVTPQRRCYNTCQQFESISHSSWVACILMPHVRRAETVRNLIYYGIHRMARWFEPYSLTPLFAYGVDIAFSGYKTFIASSSWRRRQVFIVFFIRMAGALSLN